MIEILLSLLTLFVHATLQALGLVFFGVLIFILGLVKLLLPLAYCRLFISKICNWLMFLWAGCSSTLIAVANRPQWEIEKPSSLSKQDWYLLIANHQSWADILILCHVFHRHIPMPKFFLKQQLLYVPFLGMACWALDMPFMKRHSHQHLIRHPHLRGQDIETARRSCEKFRSIPTTVINFVEGTRFTSEKQATLNSPYRHLMPTKSAGLAFTLTSMGEQFDKLLNVTLIYPEQHRLPFMALLAGRMKKIVVKVEALPINDTIVGDHFNDKPFKRQFKRWLDQLWAQKDQQIQHYYLNHSGDTVNQDAHKQSSHH